ncbi:MAG: ATPase [Candidatus Thiodiazotropha sp. (ex Ctena orbiculata)]|uniref:ATPase n=1 Tax=Candidatus Thiodiazotropha taylori TaxID=2792791 RepID=A0A944MAC4_9GAMM|nr:ATPase [Candidatus Thiodiazotropha taylori]PUB84911.1 MAG: ATPase [gamma proteobacterium symbiont of Ctena orbiculata]MBT2990239.1 ATPase [Candidatus Thiodiazotropha taylori]MBT2997971.1 ATPase [Candidatus Thiodiazotropha taylori]MBT3001758.1 ATPase [Candidatus Thiodiazotropha taylori]
MMSRNMTHTSIKRRDRLLKERSMDAYRSDHKLSDPTLCQICGAVYSAGRWQWRETLPDEAKETRCPACQRIHDRVPAGYLTLSGDFFNEHRKEIMRLVHNHVERQRTQHPLQRIIDTHTLESGEMEITFTEFHLPKGVGEALKKAYQGELHLHFPGESGQLRASWSR